MSAKKIFIFTILLSGLILLLTEPLFNSINAGVFRSAENTLFAPLFFSLIGYSITSLYLLFFSHKVFQLWLRKIVSWFLPVSVVVLLMASPTSGGVVSFDRTDYAIGLGVLLFVITVLFTLIQKFRHQN